MIIDIEKIVAEEVQKQLEVAMRKLSFRSDIPAIVANPPVHRFVAGDKRNLHELYISNLKCGEYLLFDSGSHYAKPHGLLNSLIQSKIAHLGKKYKIKLSGTKDSHTGNVEVRRIA